MCAWVYVDVICVQVVIRIALVDTHTCIRTHMHKDTHIDIAHSTANANDTPLAAATFHWPTAIIRSTPCQNSMNTTIRMTI